jgi:hypothetical protein
MTAMMDTLFVSKTAKIPTKPPRSKSVKYPENIMLSNIGYFSNVIERPASFIWIV